MRRHEHKSAINPTPMRETDGPAVDSVWSSPQRSHRRRVRIVEDDDDDDEEEAEVPIASAAAAAVQPCVDVEMAKGDEPAAAAAAAPSAHAELTADQHARRNAEYTPGDIVEIEYTVPGDSVEHVAYGEVVRMAPIPMETRSGQPTYRTMRIRWIYDYEALAEDDDIDAEALEKLDFEDGDLAFSNHEQDVNVYSAVSVHNELRESIEFYWDGRALRPAASRGKAPPEVHDEDDGEDAAEAALDLPRHLFIVQEFLFSDKIWSDTKYGADWWFTLNSLLSMGHATTNSAARCVLEQTFFDSRENNREPVRGSVTWESIEAERAKCSACGIVRCVTWLWKETQWEIGGSCKNRIDVLHNACALIFNKRAEALSSKPHMPLYWLQKTTEQLNEMRNECMQAIAGPHFAL